MRLIALIAAAAVLAGCQSPCPVAGSEPAVVSYNCEDGSTINVTYFRDPRHARLEQEGFAPVDLPSRAGSAGFRYADHGIDLQGFTGRVVLSRPGSSSTECRERAAPAASTPAPTAQSDVAIRACQL